MSDPQSSQPAVPTGPAPGSAPTEATPPPHPDRQAPQQPREPDAEPGSDSARPRRSGRDADPLRGSRTSGIWVAVLALIVVIILLSIFIAQNTQTVQVAFLGWSGSAPLSATLLIAAAGGALLVAAAGALRILQLRHRIKKARKRG